MSFNCFPFSSVSLTKPGNTVISLFDRGVLVGQWNRKADGCENSQMPRSAACLRISERLRTRSLDLYLPFFHGAKAFEKEVAMFWICSSTRAR